MSISIQGKVGTYSTIDAAYAAAVGGDIIQLGNQSYVLTERLIINKSITIQGVANPSVGVRSNSKITHTAATIQITANNVTLKNLTVETTSTTSGARVVDVLGAISNTTFNNVKFSSQGYNGSHVNYGLMLDNGDSNLTASTNSIISYVNISGCEFSNLEYGLGVPSFGRTEYVTITNTIFTNLARYGIYGDTLQPFIGAAANAYPNKIADTYMELGNVNWNISGCTFEKTGSITTLNTGSIYLEKFGKSSITNCQFIGWDSVPYSNYATALIGLQIKRASSSQAGFNTYNGEDIEITGNTFVGYPVAGTQTRTIRNVGLTLSGRNDYDNANNIPYFYNPGLIKNAVITGNTFQDLGTSLRIQNNIFGGTYGDSMIIDGNRFTDPTPATGATFRRTDISVSGTTFTLYNHGYAANDEVRFGATTTTSMPGNLVFDTTYYVMSTSLTTNTFQVSATPGGTSAVNTSSPGSGLFVDGPTISFGSLYRKSNITIITGNLLSKTGHGLKSGSAVVFGGISSTITNGTTYYVINPTADTFQIATSVTGSAMSLTNYAGIDLYLDIGHGLNVYDPIQILGGTTAPGVPTGKYFVSSVPNVAAFKITSTLTATGMVPVFGSVKSPDAIETTPSSFNITNNRYIDLSWVEPKSSIPFAPTAVNTTLNTITITNHGYNNGDAIFFKTAGVLPPALTPTFNYAINPTFYYVRDKDTNSFKVAATPDGDALSLASPVGTNTVGHAIYKLFTVDAKLCYFNIISPTKVISDSSITDAQRYSLIQSGAVSDNRVSLTTTSGLMVPITALFNAPVNTSLVIVGDYSTYTNAEAKFKATGATLDFSPKAKIIIRNLPSDAYKVVAGMTNITSADFDFVFKVYRIDGTAITTFAPAALQFEIVADYLYTLETANILKNGVDLTTVANYNRETKTWSFEVDSNPEYKLDGTATCLVEGTKVLTASGYVNVEDLKAGTRVVTGDKRFVEVVKVHNTKYNRTSSITAPYIIEKDAFGVNYPKNEIKISGRHTIQLKSGLWEVPSEAARANSKVRQVPVGSSVQYYHVELPDYENDTMVADGLVVESYNNGNYDESYTWNAAKQGYERKVVRKF